MNSADRITTLAGARALQAGRARRKPATPIELAVRCIPGYVVTPSLVMLSDVLATCAPTADAHPISPSFQKYPSEIWNSPSRVTAYLNAG